MIITKSQNGLNCLTFIENLYCNIADLLFRYKSDDVPTLIAWNDDLEALHKKDITPCA